ncbi:hypothetical protein SEA_DEJAVU_69 [Microbacterium Phage DejaVu]|nr:hypothetical protein SEA_DEJAVU_69 [Microbacterium Phage DejaVu]
MSTEEFDEYAVTEDNLKGGGGGDVKPRATYTGVIEKAESKLDKNKKIYLALQIRITHGGRKNGVIFDNYILLAASDNKFQTARRDSLYRALGYKPKQIPHGTPNGPDVSELVGTYVDLSLEHEYEKVPNEKYSLQTSKSKKSRWVIEGWEDGLDDRGYLAKSPDGEEYEAAIKPSEHPTFYAMSDEFAGVGDPNYTPPVKKSAQAKERPASTRPAATRPAASRPAQKAPEPEAAAEEDWGI